jgi:cytochrome c556
MKNSRLVLLLLASGALSAPAVNAATPPAAVGQGPGWTGITQPREVIKARQELMEHIEELMEPIDTIQVRPVRDVERLHQNAEVIGAMLLAVPHLFPPTTNLYDPKVEQPVTLALPAIWQDFPAFQKWAANAVKAAEVMASAKGNAALKAASLKLRQSCDACHAVNLRRYVPPKVQDSDIKFDFDKALGR